MKFASAVLLGASLVAANQHQHRHAHRHADKHHGSPVERRGADVTQYVEGPTETVYLLDGKVISAADVAKGLKAGDYSLVSEPIEPTPSPSSSAIPTSSSPVPTTTSMALAAEFFQKSETSTSTSEEPTSTYVPPTTSSTPEPSTSSTTPATTSSEAVATTSSAKSSSSSSSTSLTGSGIDSEFPSGEVKCSTFPSSYGAVSLEYLGLNGWTGVQVVPDFTFGVDSVISYIETAVSGSSGCTAGSFCSYACPAGYQKAQWPSAQGSTGQSIGGLYCNTDGYLELSNTDYSTLCIQGTGTITVESQIGDGVAICRTDYPGTEDETIPTWVEGGATSDLTCPDASTYFVWENLATSAQYYVNPSGYSIEDACQWGTSGSNIGNWSPVIFGVGKTTSGTFISIAQNSPTNDDGVLDFDVKIEGDISGSCRYSNGKFYDSTGEVDNGCTVGVTGSAKYVLSTKGSSS